MGSTVSDGRWRNDRRPSPRALLLLAGALLLLASCNGDDTTLPSEPPVATASTSTTEPAAVSTPAPPVTSGAPETTAVETTEPGGTSVAPTSATGSTTTAQSPTSTLPSIDVDPVAAAIATVELQFELRRECVRDLPNCDTSTFEQVMVDPQLQGDRDQIAEWQAMGYVTEGAETLTFQVLEVHLDEIIPHLVICQRDGGQLIRRQAGQPDEIVDGGYDEKIREVHLVRRPDGWRVEGFATREEVPDRPGALCG